LLPLSSPTVFFAVGVQHPNVFSQLLLLAAARVDRRGGGGGGSKGGELVAGGGSGEQARLVQSEEREEGVQERDPVRERVVRLAATDPEEDLLAAEQARIVTRFNFRRVVPVVISGSSSSSSSEEGSGVIGEDTPARKDGNIF
jgi:hypothetical protein